MELTAKAKEAREVMYSVNNEGMTVSEIDDEVLDYMYLVRSQGLWDYDFSLVVVGDTTQLEAAVALLREYEGIVEDITLDF